MLDFIKKYKSYGILLFVVIVGYWQISFLVYALKWDNIDVVFPFRHYFSQCIQAGYFPFWDPFQQTGTPFFSDLQAPTYSPELLFISLFTTYGIYTMHFLFIAYAFIAGLGMYCLSMYFNKCSWASLIAAVAYSFCGFIVGHGQHLFLLIGTAWLPFVIKNYLDLNVTRSKLNVLKTAIFVFLMVTSAYQALSIVLIYLMLLLFFYFVIKELKQKEYRAVREILLVNVYLFLVVVLFSLPLLVSTLEILPLIERFENGVSIGRSINEGQSFESLKSFLLPFSTIKQDAYSYRINFSYRNHYFGIIPFIFFIAALLKKRTVLEYLIFAYGLLIFTTVFGGLPVREFMIKHVPLMNLFLAASYTRIFGLFAFILLAANYMDSFRNSFIVEKRKVLILCGFVLVALCFFLIGSDTFVIDDIKRAFTHRSSLVNLINNRDVHQHLPLQEMFQLFVVLTFVVIVLWQHKVKYAFQLVLILAVFEIFVATQFNMSASVINTANKPNVMKKNLALYPDNFPIPLDGIIDFNEKDFMQIPGFGRNSCIFSKQVSFESFSSFKLNSYQKLAETNTNLREATLNNHLFYFSDSVRSLTQFSDNDIEPKADSKKLFFLDEDYKILSQKSARLSEGDEIEILEFSPNKVVIETHTKHDQFLTMLQTNFKGWHGFIDKQITPIYTSNFNYRTIFLPKGNHTVSYVYKNNRVLILYIFSSSLFFLSLLFLLGYGIRKLQRKGKYHVYIPLFLLMFILFFVLKCFTANDDNLLVRQVYKNRWDQGNSVFSYKKENTGNGAVLKADSIERGYTIKPNDKYFNIARINRSEAQIDEGTVVVTAKILPKTYAHILMVSSVSGNEELNKWHSGNFKPQIEKLNQWNDFIYFRNFHKLDEKDTLNIYIWNPKKEDLLIKDISVNIYPLRAK